MTELEKEKDFPCIGSLLQWLQWLELDQCKARGEELPLGLQHGAGIRGPVPSSAFPEH